MDLKGKTSLKKDELCDKIKGIIFGAAIGDGIGLATEFMGKNQAKTLFGNGPIKFGAADGHEFWRDSFRSGFFENDFTDDTDQMLLILQCLLSDNGTLNPVHLAYRIREWIRIGFPELRNKLPKGIGFTVGSTCSHKDLISNPLRAAYEVWDSGFRNMAANGALMRTSVIGAPFFWNERKVVENAMMAAKVTHSDPRSVTSAVIVSVLISRLLLGSLENGDLSEGDCTSDHKYFTEMIEMGSTEETMYLERFSGFPMPSEKTIISRPLKNRVVHLARRVTAYLTFQPLSPLHELESEFEIPRHKPVDSQRLENPVPIRPNVKSMDEFGDDEEIMKLCRDVVDKYKFLLEGHSLCPSEENGEDKAEDSKPHIFTPPHLLRYTTSTVGWVKELYSHSFPESLSSLELDEKGKIGYTFKCLGSALYLGTRKKPDEMTPNEFFEHLITELVLETGDADTNCTVAGAILGCRLGKSGLPKKWVAGLRHRDFLENISNDLCKMVLENMKEEM